MSCRKCGGSGYMDCEDCSGSGSYIKDGETVQCEGCKGSGSRCCTWCDQGVGDRHAPDQE